MRLTIGMRCRFKSKKAKEHSWSEYAGRECLLQERSSSGGFSVMILGKGTNVELKKENSGTVTNQVAWVDEEELDHIDSDFNANLDFMDWYQEHESDFCGDCLTWRPDKDEDSVCPNEKCPGRLFDSGICPHCETLKPEQSNECPKCGFDWELQW